MQNVNIDPNGNTELTANKTPVHVKGITSVDDGHVALCDIDTLEVSESIIPDEARKETMSGDIEMPVECVDELFSNAHENGHNVSMDALTAENHAEKVQ